jgi:hypothetical protein
LDPAQMTSVSYRVIIIILRSGSHQRALAYIQGLMSGASRKNGKNGSSHGMRTNVSPCQAT